MPIHLDDMRLVKQLLAGKERAFNRFFDEHHARLYRFVLTRVSHNREVAAEVAQAAMSKGLSAIARYRGEAALFTWLCVIARNEIADWARREARYSEHVVLTEDLPEIRAAVDSVFAATIDGPGQKYRRHELSRLIHVALDNLPARYGDVLEWKYIQGFSVKEIAARLEVSPEAAQSLLARAKRAFKDVYGTLARPVMEEARQ